MEFLNLQEKAQLQQILTNRTLLRTADADLRNAVLSNCGLGKYSALLPLDATSFQFVVSLCAKLSEVYITVEHSERLGLIVFLEYLIQIDLNLSAEDKEFIEYIIAKWNLEQKNSSGNVLSLELYQESTRAPSVPFPIKQHQLTELGDHRRMESDATLSNTGRIDVITHIWTAKHWSGFTGSVSVLFLDDSGNVIGKTGIHAYGVDGLYVPGKPSDRRESWVEAVSQDVVNKTNRLEIIHTTAPKDRFKSVLNEAVQASKKVSEIIQTLNG